MDVGHNELMELAIVLAQRRVEHLCNRVINDTSTWYEYIIQDKNDNYLFNENYGVKIRHFIFSHNGKPIGFLFADYSKNGTIRMLAEDLYGKTRSFSFYEIFSYGTCGDLKKRIEKGVWKMRERQLKGDLKRRKIGD